MVPKYKVLDNRYVLGTISILNKSESNLKKNCSLGVRDIVQEFMDSTDTNT